MNMELDVTVKDVLPLLQELDKWVIRYVIDNQLFGEYHPETVAQQYHSCVQYQEKYSSYRLRTKINREGLSACKWFKLPEKGGCVL